MCKEVPGEFGQLGIAEDERIQLVETGEQVPRHSAQPATVDFEPIQFPESLETSYPASHQTKNKIRGRGPTRKRPGGGCCSTRFE